MQSVVPKTVPATMPSTVPSTMPTAPATMPQAPTLQLNDIHLPEQISDFPVALGWWVLAIIIFIVVIWLVKKIVNHIALSKNKKIALKQLADNETMTRANSTALLKWAALHYFKRDQLAKLYGEKFQHFLAQQLPIKHQQRFIELTSAGFTEQYQLNDENTVDSNFNQGVKLWLIQALPNKLPTKPNTIKTAENEVNQ
ncbi:MAG: DUF4381 domain-containing protein [Colwellia sp.]